MEVLLIDDHPMLNAGIVSILEQTELFKVCAQAQSLKEAMYIIEKADTLPSLVILDLLLGEDNGLDFLPMLTKFCHNKKILKPPVLVCSALGDAFKIQAALNKGAAGFLSKTGGKEELLKAIETIINGQIYISDEVNLLIKKSSSVYAKFSKREKDVIDLLKANKSNKQIADTLHINIRTVENYISKIYFKTGYSNREEVRKL
ncbi:MAG: response regulator transcription factor [Treponema sp.]|nr:response regulator transcription factor [Treponema sp.]MCL2272620.1 response regulator transcription factor [Treponema sp.]